jgi:CRP-like cAMP-binding protein/flavin-dependent dehydrogenase
MRTVLGNGSRVAVIGGGPAGSLCAYFLLTFAHRMDLDLRVDIYEPRDFTKAGPAGCNMCGGIVSESLVQALAVEGIELPPTVVQRGIDSYVLHTDTESLRIETPLQEKRIAAVHRGGGPRGTAELRWGGLDGHLLSLAGNVGARIVPARVTDLDWRDGRPEIRTQYATEIYDLVVGATGVNSPGLQLFEKLGLPSRPCQTTRAYITEIGLANETVTGQFGCAVHMFLLNLPRLDFAAIIPKGNYLTVCLLGQQIDRDLIDAFFHSPAVKRCFPDGWDAAIGSCHCSPRINVREASTPFLDRVVLIGDCGVTRLYKDGIGAAYRTAKAAARAAIFSGVSRGDFRRHYWPVYRTIARDNRFGRAIFGIVRRIKAFPPLLRAVMRISEKEQEAPGASRRMTIVLWDMFTGSAPYREIFGRTLDPRFLVQFLWKSLGSLPGARSTRRARHTTEGVLGRHYGDGEVICRQGEIGDRMYVIEAGQAVVSREQDGIEEIVGVLGPGEVFGEMSIVEREPRSATVRARGTIRVLTLDKHAFLRQVHEDPSFAYRILQQMSRRTRSLDTTVSRLLSRGRRRPDGAGQSSVKPPSA